MKTISIIAGTITGNRGAEAMVVTTIHRIREQIPNARFNIYSYYPADDKKLITANWINVYSSTPLHLLGVLFPCALLLALFKIFRLGFLKNFIPASVKALAESDVLLDVAGVSFIDGREKFLPFNILTILPAFLLQVPVIKISQALGPFAGKINRICAQVFLRRCQMIFARGEVTFSHLQELGLDQNKFALAPDVTFLHHIEETLSHENEAYVDTIIQTLASAEQSGEKIIGMCPSAVLTSKDPKYIIQCKDIIEGLISHGFTILLFPNATRSNSMDKLRNNDLLVIQRLLEVLEPQVKKSIIHIDKDITTSSIKKLIQYCDVSVVSRFHAMIASLSMNKPILVLGWSHKYLEVMQQFGQEKFVFDYSQQMDTNEYISYIVNLSDTSISIKDKNKSVINSIQKKSATQIAYVTDLL